MAKRARRQVYAVEPSSLEEIEIPNDLFFFDESRFFIRNIDDDNNKILLFTTTKNIKLLSDSEYWIMDDTFKVVPNVFMQLFSIHAPIGNGYSQLVVAFV